MERSSSVPSPPGRCVSKTYCRFDSTPGSGRNPFPFSRNHHTREPGCISKPRNGAQLFRGGTEWSAALPYHHLNKKYRLFDSSGRLDLLPAFPFPATTTPGNQVASRNRGIEHSSSAEVRNRAQLFRTCHRSGLATHSGNREESLSRRPREKPPHRALRGRSET